MTRRITAALAVLAALAASAPVPFALAQDTGRPAPVFGVEASVVMLDVVVRDKKGRLVRDLTSSDFEIYEDGARQEVVAFRVFGAEAPGGASTSAPAPDVPAGAAPAPAPAPAAPSAPPAAPAPAVVRPAVIAFVFDRLSAKGRDTAQKAALSYLERGHVAGDIVGVFAIDLALKTMVPFTSDMDQVRPVFQKITAMGERPMESVRQEARERQSAATRAQAFLDSSQFSPAGAAAASVEAQIQAQQARMLRAFDALERDQQGYASTNGLVAIVSSLKSVPGRKTVVYFSEGMVIPANVYGPFRTLIANANQANVSVYAVDAGGLRVESGTQETRDELVQLAGQRLRQISSGRSDAPGGSMLKQLERNEDMLRLNPEAGLGQLAEETGGFLIRDTNDPSKSFGRIGEDMRFHYLLSYAPTKPGYDGAFRELAVKVKRPGLDVQTRKGYFAVRPDTVVPVRSHEAPALAVLDAKAPPSDFPLQATLLSFPEVKRPGRVPILVEIPGSALTFVENKASHAYDADFSVTVRLRDAAGLEVDRLSQQYPLTVPAAKLESAKAGNVLFFKETDVAPGRYTMDAVAYDAAGKKASVKTATVVVPEVAEGKPRLSSLLVLQRIERLSEAEKTGDNPLYYGETILYPNMGEPLKKSVTPNLGFFFTAYGTSAGATGTLELSDGTRTLARIPLSLPVPDAAGRVQHAAALPLAAVPAGRYTLRVTMGEEAVREAAFVVEE